MRRSLIHDSRILGDSFNSLIKMIISAMIYIRELVTNLLFKGTWIAWSQATEIFIFIEISFK